MISTLSRERGHLEMEVSYLLAHSFRHAKLVHESVFCQSKYRLIYQIEIESDAWQSK